MRVRKTRQARLHNFLAVIIAVLCFSSLSTNILSMAASYVSPDTGDNDLKALKVDDRPADFRYSNLSIDNLRDIKYINWADFVGVSESDYILPWMTLTLYLSTGEMQTVGLDMIDYFCDSTGSDYHNDVLTKNMEEHKNSKDNYVSPVMDSINEIIKSNNGDISRLDYNSYSSRTESRLIHKMSSQGINQPTFPDKTTGLGICVDGLYGKKIELTSFECDGTKFKYTLKFSYYDIFGLDSSDIEQPKYINGITAFGDLQVSEAGTFFSTVTCTADSISHSFHMQYLTKRVQDHYYEKKKNNTGYTCNRAGSSCCNCMRCTAF